MTEQEDAELMAQAPLRIGDRPFRSFLSLEDVVLSIEHEHIHNWIGGPRRFRHSHPLPTSEADPNALGSGHAHPGGLHRHPHGHEG